MGFSAEPLPSMKTSGLIHPTGLTWTTKAPIRSVGLSLPDPGACVPGPRESSFLASAVCGSGLDSLLVCTVLGREQLQGPRHLGRHLLLLGGAGA